MHASLENLEALLGDTILDQYRDFLEQANYDTNIDYAVDAAGFYWSVDEFFVPNSAQRSMADAYVNVRHALPAGSFPILSTLGGYLIIFGKSRNDVNVYHWDHEQSPGADEIIKVASSPEELARIIVQFDEAVGGSGYLP